ncbi:MAG: hypothetical protein MJZ82_05790 [Paludibacteraceae bacterium]|nr:hypothetical protein [Paludibacteraceae bacterium]
MKKLFTICAALLAAISMSATVADTLTCEEAVNMTMLLEDKASSTEIYAVVGFVTNTDGTISSGQQTFWMDDQKGTAKVFEAYWANLPQEVVDANLPLNLGDKVVITGNLMRYGSTAEMKNCAVEILERALIEIDTLTATVCEIIAEGESLNDGDVSEEVFDVTDVVVSVSNTNDSYHTQSFYFRCEEDGKTMQPYNISMQTEYCAEGDSVRILGRIKKYGDIVEFTGQGWVTKKGDIVVDTISATVAEAVAAGMLVDNNMTSTDVYVVEGYIDSIASAYSEQYGNMSFYMCDDMAAPTFNFEGYQITVPADQQPQVGDKVIISGKLKHYFKEADEEHPEDLHVIEIVKGDFQYATPAAIVQIDADAQKAAKVILNGQLYIIKGDNTFNAQGALVD